MTEQQLNRQAKRRLAILRHAEEVTGNVALTCRYYGISRQCFYSWKRRYDEHGLDGLRDRSSRPHHSPLATSTDVVGKIVYLRQHYHFGPHKISMYPARYHDISISRSGVWRILKGWPIHMMIGGGYVLVVLMTAIAPEEIIGIAYDSGGVTTSTITVPLVTALGIGLASSIKGRNPVADGFGLVAFASLTPIIFVMIYGLLI